MIFLYSSSFWRTFDLWAMSQFFIWKCDFSSFAELISIKVLLFSCAYTILLKCPSVCYFSYYFYHLLEETATDRLLTVSVFVMFIRLWYKKGETNQSFLWNAFKVASWCAGVLSGPPTADEVDILHALKIVSLIRLLIAWYLGPLDLLRKTQLATVSFVGAQWYTDCIFFNMQCALLFYVHAVVVQDPDWLASVQFYISCFCAILLSLSISKLDF